MASVLSAVNCPRCDAMAWLDSYYRSGEEFVSCHWCGYARSVTQQGGEWTVQETLGIASVEWSESGCIGIIQSLVETAEELEQWLSEIRAHSDLIQSAYSRRYDGTAWFEHDVLSGEERQVFPPRCEDEVE